MNVSSMPMSSDSTKNTPLLLNKELVSLPAPPDAGSIPQIAEIPLLGTPTGTTETNQVQDDLAIQGVRHGLHRSHHAMVTSTNYTNSAVPLFNQPASDNHPPDESKMKELALLLAVISLSVTLAVNAPETVKPNILFPYNAYMVLLCMSLFISFGLCTYSLVKKTPSSELDVIQRHMMLIAIGCVLISVILRLVMVLSLTSMGYDMLSFLAIIGAIVFYLWYSWRKATNLRQTPPSEIPLPTIAADQV